MPDAIWLRIAGSGSSIPIKTIVSNRLNISLQELACPVDKLPSCPVFIACSTSSASAPRHSPTITRVGLMRSAVLIRSRIVIGRTPSVLAFLVSNRTKLGLSINCSSAESSIVIIRSSLGINCDNRLHKDWRLYFKVSRLSCTNRFKVQCQAAVKVHGVFPSSRGYTASSQRFRFHWVPGGDSVAMVTPFVQVGTCPTRNFATLGPL